MSEIVKIGLVIILGGIGVGGYYFYDFSTNEAPKLEQARSQKERLVTEKKGELRRLQDFAKNIQQIKREIRELNYQLESALEHMPRTFNLPALLRRLTMLAQNSGVELTTFKPRKEEAKKEGAFYSTVLVDFDIKGSFTQTLVFLDQVSRLKRIVNLDSISLHGNPSNGVRAGAIVADTNATLRTYRFSE